MTLIAKVQLFGALVILVCPDNSRALTITNTADNLFAFLTTANEPCGFRDGIFSSANGTCSPGDPTALDETHTLIDLALTPWISSATIEEIAGDAGLFGNDDMIKIIWDIKHDQAPHGHPANLSTQFTFEFTAGSAGPISAKLTPAPQLAHLTAPHQDNFILLLTGTASVVSTVIFGNVFNIDSYAVTFMADHIPGPVPPAAAGITSKTLNAKQGEMLSETISFSGPEVGENVTISVQDPDGAQGDGLNLTILNGSPGTAELAWTPGVALIGKTYDLTFDFSDSVDGTGYVSLTGSHSLSLQIVPEPSTAILLGFGLLGLLTTTRRFAKTH